MSTTFVFKPHTLPKSTTFVFGEVRAPVDTDVSFYSGEQLTFTLDIPTIAVMYHGDILDSTIDFRPQYQINTMVLHGQYVQFQLARFIQLPPLVYDGSYLLTEIKYSPVLQEPFSVYHGETLDSLLRTEVGVAAAINDGAYYDANLIVPENIKIIAELYSGQYFVSTMSYSVGFATNVYDGSELTSNVRFSANIVPNIYHGESLFTDISYFPIVLLTSDVYDGSVLNNTVQYTINITGDIYHGEYLTHELDTAPQDNITVDIYHGEYVNFSLDTQILIGTNIYSGSHLYAVVEDTKPLEPSTTFYSGQTLYLNDLYYNFSLGQFNAFDGQHVFAVVDEQPNIDIFYGERLDFNLSTTQVYTSNMYDGSVFEPNLSTFESQPLGQITMYDGQHLSYMVNTLRSVNFTCRISHDMSFKVDRWKSLDVMLGTKCCHKENKHNQLQVDLSSQPDTDLIVGRSIVGTKLEFDLSVTRLFDFTITHGSVFSVTEENGLNVNMYGGQQVYANLYIEPVIHLSTGALSYNGTIVYELDKLLPRIETSYRATHGESLTLGSIALFYRYDAEIYTGQRLSFELLVPEAIRPNILDGSTLETKMQMIPTLSFSMLHGSTFNAQIFESPYEIRGGEYVIVESIDTDYEVEFTESGQLINTYTEVDKDGVPIISDEREAAIEGGRYEKFIKGRCF